MDSSFYRRVAQKVNILRVIKKLLKNKKAMALLVVGAAVIGYGIIGNHGIIQRVRLQHEKEELERKIKEANDETKALQLQSRELDSSKKAIEKVARERYGMAREGEHVYKATGSDH
ncbi:MAG: septum formation initiator family protein [Bacteroidota bacterium]